MLGPTEEAIADLRAAGEGPVNLFAAVQRLALEIAGRTMFSLEMREHSGVLRDLVGRYNVRLARIHLLDIVLPVGIPSPHDIARHFFARRWMQFSRISWCGAARPARARPNRATSSICCSRRATPRRARRSRPSSCATKLRP